MLSGQNCSPFWHCFYWVFPIHTRMLVKTLLTMLWENTTTIICISKKDMTGTSIFRRPPFSLFTYTIELYVQMSAGQCFQMYYVFDETDFFFYYSSVDCRQNYASASLFSNKNVLSVDKAQNIPDQLTYLQWIKSSLCYLQSWKQNVVSRVECLFRPKLRKHSFLMLP